MNKTRVWWSDVIQSARIFSTTSDGRILQDRIKWFCKFPFSTTKTCLKIIILKHETRTIIINDKIILNISNRILKV